VSRASSRYLSDDCQTEIVFPGIGPSPLFVRQPEVNSCVERLMRSLKEQLLWVGTLQNLEGLPCALTEFRER
jgi:putative transposase